MGQGRRRRDQRLFQLHDRRDVPVLKSHSILGDLMRDDSDDEAAFTLGVDRALDDKSFLSLVFSVRTEALFGHIAPESLSSYLSGLLIGFGSARRNRPSRHPAGRADRRRRPDQSLQARPGPCRLHGRDAARRRRRGGGGAVGHRPVGRPDMTLTDRWHDSAEHPAAGGDPARHPPVGGLGGRRNAGPGRVPDRRGSAQFTLTRSTASSCWPGPWASAPSSAPARF